MNTKLVITGIHAKFYSIMYENPNSNIWQAIKKIINNKKTAFVYIEDCDFLKKFNLKENPERANVIVSCISKEGKIWESPIYFLKLPKNYDILIYKIDPVVFFWCYKLNSKFMKKI